MVTQRSLDETTTSVAGLTQQSSIRVGTRTTAGETGGQTTTATASREMGSDVTLAKTESVTGGVGSIGGDEKSEVASDAGASETDFGGKDNKAFKPGKLNKAASASQPSITNVSGK